jgi:hypothetical protein
MNPFVVWLFSLVVHHGNEDRMYRLTTIGCGIGYPGICKVQRYLTSGIVMSGLESEEPTGHLTFATLSIETLYNVDRILSSC